MHISRGVSKYLRYILRSILLNNIFIFLLYIFVIIIKKEEIISPKVFTYAFDNVDDNNNLTNLMCMSSFSYC